MQKLSTRNVRLDIDYLTKFRYERSRMYYAQITNCEHHISQYLGDDGPYAVRDIFSSIYSGNNAIDDSVKNTNLKRILDWMDREVNKIPEYQRIKLMSRGDLLVSCMSCETLVNNICKVLADNISKKEKEKDYDENAAFNDYLNADGDLVRITKTGGGMNNAYIKKNGKKRGSNHPVSDGYVRNYVAALEKAGYRPANKIDDPDYQQIDDSLIDRIESDDEIAAELRMNVKYDIIDTINNAKTAMELASFSYGIQESDIGATANTDPELIKTVSTCIENRKLADLLREMGKFYDSMRESKSRSVIHGNIIPYDINNGSNLSNIIPSEMALLCNESTKSYQISRLLAGQTLSVRKCDIGTKENGPFHVCLDISGSMQTSEIIAKAFALAAIKAAIASNRKVSFSVFNTKAQWISKDLSNVSEKSEMLMKLINLRMEGGTRFEPIIDLIGETDENTDVLLISDGAGSIDENKTLEVFGTRDLHYLIIGNEMSSLPLLISVAGKNHVYASNLMDGDAIDIAARAAIK